MTKDLALLVGDKSNPGSAPEGFLDAIDANLEKPWPKLMGLSSWA